MGFHFHSGSLGSRAPIAAAIPPVVPIGFICDYTDAYQSMQLNYHGLLYRGEHLHQDYTIRDHDNG